MEPTFLEPTFLEPTFLEPTFLEPTFLEPTFLEPTFLKPTFLEPTFLEPTFLEPTFLEPTFWMSYYLLDRHIVLDKSIQEDEGLLESRTVVAVGLLVHLTVLGQHDDTELATCDLLYTCSRA